MHIDCIRDCRQMAVVVGAQAYVHAYSDIYVARNALSLRKTELHFRKANIKTERIN